LLLVASVKLCAHAARNSSAYLMVA